MCRLCAAGGVAPKRVSRSLEPLVIGGLAFYKKDYEKLETGR
jgi:hypothetical protein